MSQNNFSQSELLHSVTVFKDTVPLMRSNGIPLTPENYALWYTYSNGNIHSLNQAVERNLANGTEFTKQFNQSLYEKFIEPLGPNALESYQIATKELIEKLLSELLDAGGGSEEYVNSMEDCEKRLLESPDVAQLSIIVSQVIKKTRKINEANRGLVSNLKSMEDEVSELKLGVATLVEQANTDQLTKVANRRGLEANFNSFLESYQATGQSFSLLLVDIDHFKDFNDIHGHVIGDKVLTYVASALSSNTKAKDAVARFGGEEFVVLLNRANKTEALKTAEQLRVLISQKTLRSNQAKESLGNITVSIGVATISDKDDMNSLLDRADKAMYKAKEAGRNQVCEQN